MSLDAGLQFRIVPDIRGSQQHRVFLEREFNTIFQENRPAAPGARRHHDGSASPSQRDHRLVQNRVAEIRTRLDENDFPRTVVERNRVDCGLDGGIIPTRTDTFERHIARSRESAGKNTNQAGRFHESGIHYIRNRAGHFINPSGLVQSPLCGRRLFPCVSCHHYSSTSRRSWSSLP